MRGIGTSDSKLVKYFCNAYPRRSAGLRKSFFRHGEAERLGIVKDWLPSTQGLSILDAGCGDGQFLSSVISGYPGRIRVEDIVSENVATACRVLNGQACVVEGMTCDTFACNDSGFDVVLAIGLLDYQQNWHRAVTQLSQRSRSVVIADVPRFDASRNWLRSVWLRGHGVRLQLVKKAELVQTLSTIGLDFELRKTRFQWFMRIRHRGKT